MGFCRSRQPLSASWITLLHGGETATTGFSFTYTSMSVFQDNDWDTSVQFLPASDNKKLEKKKGLGKIGAVIGVVVFAAVVALMTGLLVWHFHCKNNLFVGFRDQ